MTVNSSENSVILILFAFSDNLSVENSKLPATAGTTFYFLGCMDDDDNDEYDDDAYGRQGERTCGLESMSMAMVMSPWQRSPRYIIIIIIIIIMVTQHIPTSQIPTRWESDIMMKGGNMTQSNSHHTHISIIEEPLHYTLKSTIEKIPIKYKHY